MDDVLMLKDMRWEDCYIKDYLCISGYRVVEMDIRDEDNFEKNLAHKDVVILACENARFFFDKVEKVRLYTEIPLMVVAKTDDEWARIKVFQLGADDYITVPFQEMAFIARVQARIDQFRRLTRLFGHIRVRDLIIESLNRKVYLNNEEIIMTVKEFDILLYLAQHGNIPVAKDELYYAVWKQKAVEGTSGAVSTYVKRVRQKIEKDPFNPQYIETVWGVGYRFIS